MLGTTLRRAALLAAAVGVLTTSTATPAQATTSTATCELYAHLRLTSGAYTDGRSSAGEVFFNADLRCVGMWTGIVYVGGSGSYQEGLTSGRYDISYATTATLPPLGGYCGLIGLSGERTGATIAMSAEIVCQGSLIVGDSVGTAVLEAAYVPGNYSVPYPYYERADLHGTFTFVAS